MGEQAAKTKKTETSLPEGKIVQVSGPVVDVKFESGPLPEIRDALTVENQGKTCVCWKLPSTWEIISSAASCCRQARA